MGSQFGAARFTFEHFEFAMDLDCFDDDGGELWVLEDMRFGPGSIVYSWASPLLFQYYTRHMHNDQEPKPRAARKPRAPVAKTAARAKLLDEYPWLTLADLEDDAMQSDADESDGDDAAPVEFEFDEAMYEELRKKRDEERAEHKFADEDMFFYTAQRGGEANIDKIGHMNYCAAMFARAGVANMFCERFGFPKLKSYHYTEYGGRPPQISLPASGRA